jgi:hypothetical protein
MNEHSRIDAREPAILSLPDETRFADSGIVSRTLLQTPSARVVLFGFAEGQELSEHASSHRRSFRFFRAPATSASPESGTR